MAINEQNFDHFSWLNESVVRMNTMSAIESVATRGKKKFDPQRVPWIGLICITVVSIVTAMYWSHTGLPQTVRIAGGPEGGRYDQLAQSIAQELRDRHGIDAQVVPSQGSLENLQLLESHEVDLALYQPGTRLILEGDTEHHEKIMQPARFISNMYSEYLLPIAPAGSPASFPKTDGQLWCCNDEKSGDYAATRLLLQHLNADSRVKVNTIGYTGLSDALSEQEINIGILCCGLQAPVLPQVMGSGTGQLVPIPGVEAMAAKNASIQMRTIPAGYFSTEPMSPTQEYHTVAFSAQLLADREASVRLVEEVTKIVSDARFQRRMKLTELFAGGRDYAVERPEYAIHTGAANVHFPGLKPLLNPDFVEGTEGLRSFLVSLVAAVWLLHRWWTRKQIRSQEHRLDRYIRELLELEIHQMGVDGEGGEPESDALQEILDQVTILRQEALQEFTAHELNEDRAVDCFIEMCHALSDKINAKLTRYSLRRLQTAIVEDQGSSES